MATQTKPKLTFRKDKPERYSTTQTYSIRVDGECVGKISQAIRYQRWYWYSTGEPENVNTLNVPGSATDLEGCKAECREHFKAKPKPQPTVDDLAAFINEAEEEFGMNTNVAYRNVTYTQLSIARYYGGIDVNGKRFIYNQTDDSLMREDVLKWLTKRMEQ